ncbi:MAG: hypothetical protein R2849_00890 [Thermomicrobiales bacterium]
MMNTVGKPGRLGEQVVRRLRLDADRGLDANTVTHILRVRAFEQLLCEQVVGRGCGASATPQTMTACSSRSTLRSTTCPSFIPTSGSTADPKPGPIPTRVRALDERSIWNYLPAAVGYRYDIREERLLRVRDERRWR